MNSVNSPGSLSTSIEPPCCWVTISQLIDSHVGVLLTGALATVWTAPPVVAAAAVVMGIAVIAIATLRREVIRVE